LSPFTGKNEVLQLGRRSPREEWMADAGMHRRCGAVFVKFYGRGHA